MTYLHPQSKPRRLFRLGTFVMIMSAAVPNTQAQLPMPVQDMAFARVGSGLYVQGGWVSANGVQTLISPQNFALDLSTSWSVDSPPWKSLAGGDMGRSFTAVGSPDNQTFSTFKVYGGSPSPTAFLFSSYNIQQNKWTVSRPLSNNDCLIYGSIVAMDPVSGLAFITGAGNLNIYDINANSWLPSVPIPSGSLKQKVYGRGVYNTARNSLMYLGGYNNDTVGPSDSTTFITEYNTVSKSWSIFVKPY